MLRFSSSKLLGSDTIGSSVAPLASRFGRRTLSPVSEFVLRELDALTRVMARLNKGFKTGTLEQNSVMWISIFDAA